MRKREQRALQTARESRYSILVLVEECSKVVPVRGISD